MTSYCLLTCVTCYCLPTCVTCYCLPTCVTCYCLPSCVTCLLCCASCPACYFLPHLLSADEHGGVRTRIVHCQTLAVVEGVLLDNTLTRLMNTAPARAPAPPPQAHCLLLPAPTPPPRPCAVQMNTAARAPAKSPKLILKEAFWKVDPSRTGSVSCMQFLQVRGLGGRWTPAGPGLSCMQFLRLGGRWTPAGPGLSCMQFL